MKLLLISFVLIINLSGCSWFESLKPKNEKFYCKIGGKKFRPNTGSNIFTGAPLFDLNQDINRFDITANSFGNDDDRMSVLISVSTKSNILVARKYELSQEGKGYCSKGYISIGGSNINHGYEAFLSSGYVEFTKVDTLKRRVSGTFAFKAKSKYTNSEIAVTDGQFNDVFYY